MISREEDAITFAEETDLSICMSWHPKNLIAFVRQVEILTILNWSNSFVWWYANNAAHSLLVCLCEPQFSMRQAMLHEEFRNTLEALRKRPCPVSLNSGFINGVHIDGGTALFLQLT